MDEDAGPLDVVGDDADMGTHQGDQVDAGTEDQGAGIGRLDRVGGSLEA